MVALTWSDTDKFSLIVTPNILIAMTCGIPRTGCGRRFFYNFVQPRSCENNFGRLRLVQTEVVCSSPVLNIFEFRVLVGACLPATIRYMYMSSANFPIELKILTGCRSDASAE